MSQQCYYLQLRIYELWETFCQTSIHALEKCREFMEMHIVSIGLAVQILLYSFLQDHSTLQLVQWKFVATIEVSHQACRKLPFLAHLKNTSRHAHYIAICLAQQLRSLIPRPSPRHCLLYTLRALVTAMALPQGIYQSLAKGFPGVHRVSATDSSMASSLDVGQEQSSFHFQYESVSLRVCESTARILHQAT